MAKILWKGAALLAPLPVCLVTCGTEAAANVFTVAWTGIVCTHPAMTYISVRPTRHSYGIIRETGEFALHPVTEAFVRAADSCGVYTGRKVDKFTRFKLTREPSAVLSAPLVAELPLALDCRVRDVIPLGTHDMFLSEIVGVEVAPELIDETGKLRLERAELAAFAHGAYYSLGRRIGDFGFSVRKEHKSAAPRAAAAKHAPAKKKKNAEH